MWGRKGGARGALGVPGQERPGARSRSGAAPVTLRKTDPEGKIRAPHSRLPPPSGGLGTVPGALAPSHELHDEVRTSAQDRVAAPSPLGNNLSRHPQIPETVPPTPVPAGVQPPSPAAYLPGAAGESRPPGPSVRAGPRVPGKTRCPRAGRDSLWVLGPPQGRTSSAGRKKPEPRPKRRSRETGGGPPWPGLAAGVGRRVTQLRAGLRSPGRSQLPLATPMRPLPAPRAPSPWGRPAAPCTSPLTGACAPRLGWPPRRRVHGLCVPVRSRLQPGGEGHTEGGGREEGGGGERAAPRPYKERPGEGAGRAGKGGPGRKLPQEGALILPQARGSAEVRPPPPHSTHCRPRHPGPAQTPAP